MNNDMAAADDGGGDKRASRRARVLLGARLHSFDGSVDTWIRDVSASGALLACKAVFAPGTQVVLTRGDTAVPGRIAWARGGKVGLAFDWIVDEARLLVSAPPPAPGQQPAYRRPGFGAGAPLSDEDRETIEIWGGA